METLSKKYYVTKKRVAEYIQSLESGYSTDGFKTRSTLKAEIRAMMNSELVKTDSNQLKFFNAVIKALNVNDDMDIPKDKIMLLGWLKNNEQWYYPFDLFDLRLDNWENYEIIHYVNKDNFLVFCWNGKKNYNNSRLFKAKVK